MVERRGVHPEGWDRGGPALRASDAEREAVVALLTRHAADGRLDLQELDERVDAALAARTHAELGPLTADLPELGADPAQLDVAVPEERELIRELYGHVTIYAVVIIGLWLLWIATGADGMPWPVWATLGWGLGVVGHARRTREQVREIRAAPAETRAEVALRLATDRGGDGSSCGGRRRGGVPPRLT